MTPYALLAAVLTFTIVSSSGVAAGGQAQPVPPPPLTREQMAQFLQTAKVIGHKGISKGVTSPARLTLSDGTLTHDAAFSRVNEHKPIMDSWKFLGRFPSLAQDSVTEQGQYYRRCREPVPDGHWGAGAGH